MGRLHKLDGFVRVEGLSLIRRPHWKRHQTHLQGRPRRTFTSSRWPAESMAALGQTGLLGMTLPRAEGGSGAGPRTFAAVTKTRQLIAVRFFGFRRRAVLWYHYLFLSSSQIGRASCRERV